MSSTTENISDQKNYALVTGASSGIGYELARCLADDDYDLVLVSRSNEALQTVANNIRQEYGVNVMVIAKDLIVPSAAKEVYDEVKSNGIIVDILVNDAGQGVWGKFEETELDREIDTVHLNVIALISLTKYFLKDMLSRNSGKILQLASSLSKVPSPYMAVYGATKAFVYSFTEALIQEVKDSEVSITALQPNATDTDFFHKAEAENTVVYKETELYSPEEVAKAGYKALMAGKAKVQPGAKTKLQGIMGNLLPDEMVAKSMEAQMKPSDKQDGKSLPDHEISLQSRERINAETGTKDGDSLQHEGHVHEN